MIGYTLIKQVEGPSLFTLTEDALVPRVGELLTYDAGENGVVERYRVVDVRRAYRNRVGRAGTPAIPMGVTVLVEVIR